MSMVIEREPLLWFTRDGDGWVLSLDGEHYTSTQAADVANDYKFAGFVFTRPGRATAVAVSDSHAQVARYAGMVEAAGELAKRLTVSGSDPDYVLARAEELLADGHDPELVRCNRDLAGPFNDPDEVADRMNELAGEASRG